MARQPRYALPGYPQHVIQRGNNRQIIFAASPDYLAFVRWLQVAAQKYSLAIHAYVLMTNHFHLLVTPHQQQSIGKVIQSVGRRYVQYFNFCYGRTGTLWEGRYRATLIDTEAYLLTCCRYIELNPVRANMVTDPAEYPWSSYRRLAYGEADTLITPHASYLQLGDTVESRQQAYRSLFQQSLEAGVLSTIREATHRGWALGGERFRTEIELLSRRRAQPLPKGRPSKKKQ